MKLRLAGFSGMLLSTMAMSTLAFFALAVAASELEAEFDISKFEIGLLGAVNTLVGGLFAPYAGRVSDLLGGRASMAGTLILSGLSAIGIGLSSSYMMLFIAMAFAGLPQGWGNPACNKAIATGIVSEQRGILTGIKQSGVQSAVFAAGFLVPWIVENYGWRATMWLVVAISGLSLLGLPLVTMLPADGPQDGDASGAPTNKLSPFVTQVAIYGFLLGIVGGGLGRFLPLFAEQEVGLSLADAGRVFGLQGLVAIPCRLLAGIALDRGVPARLMLLGMGIVGAGSILLVLAATGGGAKFLVIGTIIGGMTLGSWNTAANLSMVRQPDAGRATGRLMLGFLIGLTVGGPIVGWSIDYFDNYGPAWTASALLALLGAAVVSRQTDGEVAR